MQYGSAQKVFDHLPAFDPEQGTVVLEPEGQGSGYWVGCPSVMYDAERQSYLMTYRRRRPRGAGSDRGYACFVAESKDGVHFEDIWTVRKEQFGTTSMERFNLHKVADNRYLLFVSYVDPADNRWRIDMMEADRPDGFDPARARNLFTGNNTNTEGCKDPYVIKVGPAYYMFISYATRQFSAEQQAKAHATADIYNTGLTTAPSALAVSVDGINWHWHGEVLPVGTGWDRYQSRLNSVVRVGQTFVGFYDGCAGVEENYEERCGVALSPDLVHWTKVTCSGPWVVAPHGSGSVRYVDVLTVGDQLWFYYEYVRPDGSHELRLNKVAR